METIKKLKREIESALAKAQDKDALDDLRSLFLGRKGKLTLAMKKIATLSTAEKPKFGAAINDLKKYLESEIATRLGAHEVATADELEVSERIDITEPGLPVAVGHPHPVSLAYGEILRIFERLSFKVVLGPEIDKDWYNFEALNIPPDHPARDTQATFFVNAKEKWLLRTHVSSVQIRVMEKEKPPIRVVVPGRVYRRDVDPTHTPMFNQVEGLLIDETTNFAELKGTLTYFAKEYFGRGVMVRFRPHHFPFTEPSAEMDISCSICSGTGLVGGTTCKVCKGTKWLEILGAGMVHPNVLKAGGIDPDKYRGFAFGMGADRPAMLKYGIPDLRLMFENDMRFLEQF